jgi:hypothetical protein
MLIEHDEGIHRPGNVLAYVQMVGVDEVIILGQQQVQDQVVHLPFVI